MYAFTDVWVVLTYIIRKEVNKCLYYFSPSGQYV